MLRVLLEGDPGSFPVQPLSLTTPLYWEAGAIAMLDTLGNAVVSDGVTNVFGLLADRRNTTVGISNATFLPSNPGAYGDESLFNQPGYGNSLYGTTGTTNNVIPANTIPTTTLLRDETASNPNVGSRFVTVYIRGGLYATDQFDSTIAVTSFVPGVALYVMTDGTGRLTTTTHSLGIVGVVTAPVDGNGLLQFKLTLV
jgi:hypothetical protein